MAVACVDEERSTLRTERNAFREFRDVVSRMRPLTADGGIASDEPIQVKDQAASTARIRQTYRETVMAVPDYQSQYGDSFETHTYKELTPQLGSSIASNGPLTPSLKQNLLIAVSTCIEQRSTLVSTLGNERKWLCDARERLQTLDKDSGTLPPCSVDRLSFPELEATWQKSTTWKHGVNGC